MTRSLLAAPQYESFFVRFFRPTRALLREKYSAQQLQIFCYVEIGSRLNVPAQGE
jgi:hypothetical protein